MTTTCSKPRGPAAAENLSSGRDGPSTLSVESLRSNEIDTVARDLVLPRDVRGEHACLPAPFQPGLPCPSDRSSNRHMLLPERTSLQNSSVLPTEYEIPTDRAEDVDGHRRTTCPEQQTRAIQDARAAVELHPKRCHHQYQLRPAPQVLYITKDEAQQCGRGGVLEAILIRDGYDGARVQLGPGVQAAE